MNYGFFNHKTKPMNPKFSTEHKKFEHVFAQRRRLARMILDLHNIKTELPDELRTRELEDALISLHETKTQLSEWLGVHAYTV
jgi:hypothetical protein